jgi:Na+-translocating ferredoxin:NAD+ oxidoreductase RNF subunit RnfB
MTNTVIWTIAIITVLGLLLALVLYLVAKKFKVEEDPRIDEVEKVMPGANCGGCGFAGCRARTAAAAALPDVKATPITFPKADRIRRFVPSAARTAPVRSHRS